MNCVVDYRHSVVKVLLAQVVVESHVLEGIGTKRVDCHERTEEVIEELTPENCVAVRASRHGDLEFAVVIRWVSYCQGL